MSRKITVDLDKLNESDIYSMSLFLLYKLTNIPKYSAISELPYLLDEDNLFKLITYFGGRTLKIPTLEEFKSTLRVLLLYQSYKIENKTWKESLSSSGYAESEYRQADKQLIAFETLLHKHNIDFKDFYDKKG